jgi:hypothetical protein
MNDTEIVTHTCNPLAPVVVGLIRSLSMERAAHDSTRFVLHEAISMLHDQDRQLDRARDSARCLREQIRQTMRTDGPRQRDQFAPERREAGGADAGPRQDAAA